MEKNRHHNVSEEKKQRLKEYQNREAKKSQYNNQWNSFDSVFCDLCKLKHTDGDKSLIMYDY